MLIPAMKNIIDLSTAAGVESYIIGMPHRGRLNVLANVARQPLEQIFCRFNAHVDPEDKEVWEWRYGEWRYEGMVPQERCYWLYNMSMVSCCTTRWHALTHE